MKLFVQYFKFTLQQALKRPRQALKILPGLGFLIGGIIFALFYFFTIQVHEINPDMINLGKIYLFIIPSIFFVILFIQAIQGGALGFRSCDANLLMTGPVSKFDAYLFVMLKSFMMYLGLSIFMAATQSPGIIQLTGNRMPVVFLAITLLISLVALGSIGYLLTYFRIQYEKISKIVNILILVGLIALFYFSYQSSGIAFVESSLLHLIPFIGWNLGIAHYSAIGNYTMVLVYYVVYIVSAVGLYFICSKLKFDYYEYELSKVAKTDKAYQKLTSGGSNADVKFFRKSNLQFKSLNEKAIIEFSRISAGKFFMASLITIMGLVFEVGFLILLNFSIPKDAISPFFSTIILLIGIKMYMSTFSFTENGVYTDFYLKLFPIKTVYKVTYYHFIKFLSELIQVILFTVITAVICVMKDYDIIYALYVFLATFAFGVSEVLRLENIWNYVIRRFGKTLTLILSIIEGLVKAVIIIGGSVWLYFVTNTPVIPVIYIVVISIIYSVIWTLIGIKLYDSCDISEYKTN